MKPWEKLPTDEACALCGEWRTCYGGVCATCIAVNDFNKKRVKLLKEAQLRGEDV